MTDEEGTKLQGIAAGAQVNVIDAVSSEFSLGDNKTLTVTAVDSSKITGLSDALAGKVNVESGKGLSTNDYTTEEKTKLSGIEEGAEVNVIETIQVNGSEQTPSGKTVNIAVPTTVAQLTDSGNYALKTEIPTTVAQLTDSGNYALKSDITNVYKYKGSVDTVSALPSEGNTVGDIYNVEDTDMNYAWDGEKWDAMGSSFQIDAITNQEIDDIFAA